MATVKIDTAVDASAFAAMYEIFSRFQAGVNAQPDAWGKVAAAGGEARGSLEDAARSVRTLADNMDDILHRVRGLDNETEKVSRRWTSLARGTKEAAGHIKDVTGSLLKWAGITGLVAGVVGFGAEHLIFGLGRGVSANRSAAMGAGTSYGGLQAARLAYGRYGSGEGMLGKIADAQGDPSQRLPFGAVGMGAKDYAGRDSADVLADFMKRAKDTLDQWPKEELGSRLRVTHLGDFMSLEEARRMKSDSRENVYGQADSIAGNKRVLNLDPKVQLQWQKFTTAMERAGTTMETMLVNRLVALEPGLKDLSEAVTKIAGTLLAEKGPVDQWLHELDHGMEWLAKNIDKPEFQDQVKRFVAEIGEMAVAAWTLTKYVAKTVHWFAKLVGDNDAPTPGGLQALASGTVGDHIPTSAPLGAIPSAHGRAGFMQRGNPAAGPGRLDEAIPDPHAPGMAAHEKHIIDYAKSIGIDPRVALTVAHSEGLNTLGMSKWGAGADHGRSHGAFQLFSGGGLGDKYKKETGKDPYDEHNALDMEEWALRYAKKNGWNDWHGATKHGIRGFYGIDRNAANTPAPTATGLRNRAPTVTINKNTGANPPALAAAVAAPQ